MSSLTRIEALNKENYDTWKMHMEALLIKCDAWSYVEGKTVKPTLVVGDADSQTAVDRWTVNDKKAKSEIILAISPSELKQVKGCETSREVWLKLESIYQSKGPARKATLLKHLMLQRMQEGEDVRVHLRSFFDAVDKLSEMEVDINPDLLSIMILYSLPPSFENFRCAIESRDELPTPEILRVKTIEESDARKNDNRTEMPSALAVGRNFGKRWNVKSKSKDVSNKQVPSDRYESKIRCFKCHNIGHKASECPRKDGNSRQPPKKADDMCVLALPKSTDGPEALRAENEVRDGRWCLDSGCTSHLCKDSHDFVQLRDSGIGTLNLASNASTQIQAAGTVVLKADVNGQPANLTLEDTLFVPDLRTNLLSVGKIVDKGYTVAFSKDIAKVTDRDGNTRMVADRSNGLYYLREDEYERQSSLAARESTFRIKDTSLEGWHRRMGHLNIRDLVDGSRKEAVHGFNLKKPINNFDCDICIRAKMSKTPFPKRSERSSELLEIIHTDICGPMRVCSKGKARYFITFIDDHSRWCEIYVLKHKSEALDAFKGFKALVENQTGRKIKQLQSDNGKEFLNNAFDDFLKTHGIKRRLTVAHTPEQNGIAERKNRTLVEMARCLLLQSGLSSPFWGEAISTANYIRNRCPTSSLNGKTPHEKWHGKKPNVQYFREFGCTAYCSNGNPNKGKFEPRAKKGIFVGYSELSKAYRIWLPETGKIEISRDVRFLENVIGGSNDVYEEFFPEDPLTTAEDVTEEPDNIRIVEIPITRIECEEDEIERNDHDDDDVAAVGPQAAANRGRGRPRKILTGLRGRPRKQYHEARIAEEAYAYMAEVPVKQAVSSPESDEWYNAMAAETRSIIKNDTWEMVDRPKRKDIIGGRFVLRNKYDPDGNLQRRKARIVAQGFAQRPGIDFVETFAPVARLSSVRLMAALASHFGMKIHQLDITTAYLNGIIEEDIHMEIPKFLPDALEIITQTEPSNSEIRAKANSMLACISAGDKVCRLKKALYGLRQSGRRWYDRLNKALKEFGATPSIADPCVYIVKRGEDLMIVTVYVDDILVASKNVDLITDLKNFLADNFEVNDLGEAKCCLGIEFSQQNDIITMNQRGYIKDLLDRFGMSDSKPVSTPMDIGVKLKKSEAPADKESEKFPYRELIGGLMYLAVTTRPDVAYAVSSLSQFLTCYEKSHWTAAKRILRYLKNTVDYGLEFRRSSKPLIGYVDADWGSCHHDRRSYTGYCFVLSGCAISWEAKKQRTVALSSTEAEYMALTEAAKESIYLRKFLVDLGLNDLADVRVYNDNFGAQKLAENPVFHNRTKHIDIKHHFVREVLNNGQMKLEHISTEDMAADGLTKGLAAPKHLKCLKIMGLTEVSTISNERSRIEGKCQR